MENTNYSANNSVYACVLLSIIAAIAGIYYAINISFNTAGFKPANWFVLLLLATASISSITIAIRRDSRLRQENFDFQ